MYGDLQRPYLGTVTSEDLQRYVDFALDSVTQAGEEIVKGFRTQRLSENKASGGAFDPVTAWDRAGESILRESIEHEWPKHGIFGEEFGLKHGNGLTWVMDPIDGTRAFMSGLLHWGVLLALFDGTRVLLGVMYQPYTKELFWGTGTEAYFSCDDTLTQLQTSDCGELDEATLSTTDPNLFEDDGERAGFDKLSKSVKLTRYGGDCYQYGLVAMGFIDVVVENQLKPWDIQALIPIIHGSGGCITNWKGGDPSFGGQVVASSSLSLHRQVLDRLNVS